MIPPDDDDEEEEEVPAEAVGNRGRAVSFDEAPCL